MSSSIEEQFQPPEWATKDEVIKAAQHYINYWKIEARHRNQQWLDALSDNARLKAEVERLTAIVGADAIDREHGMCCDASAQVERMTKERDKALTDFWGIHEGYFRLQAEVNRLTAFTTRTIIPNEELQAQVERLTKAGDAMAEIFKNEMDNEPDCVGYLQEKLVNRWLAAKEGKQP